MSVPLPPAAPARGGVETIQRERLITAAIETIAAVGSSGMTVARIAERARMSRRTFYEFFAGAEDCVLAAFESTLAELRARMLDAYSREANWRAGTRTALGELLDVLEDSPAIARLCVVESLAAGPRVRAAGAQALGEAARALHTRAGGRERGVPPLTAEALVGGVAAVLHTRLVSEDPPRLGSLLGPMMASIVLAYAGGEQAAAELRVRRRRRPPTPRLLAVARDASAYDQLAGLRMRVTYRTMLVLSAIGERPGASNREVANAAGIADQGQVSKLLRRLVGLGLVENRGVGQKRGAANEWHLKERGAALVRAAAGGAAVGFGRG